MIPPRTIPEALHTAAESDTGEYVFHLDGGQVSISCAELADRADRAARRLVALGVEPGDMVGVLGPNRPEWVVSAFAVWTAGAALVPVQAPLRIRDPGAFRDQIRGLVEAGACRHVLADPRFAPMLPEGIAVPWGEVGEESAEVPPGPVADSAAVIQFTSGSTAAPKGALLTHSAVMAQMEILQPARANAEGVPRVILSWAPFFHDLGLMSSLILPSVWGTSSRQLPTDRFARDPVEWLRLVEETRCTMTIGPSSAFGSAIRVAQRRGQSFDLSSLEVAFFAGEGVDPNVARRLTESDFGLRPEALGSTYGLAETVLAAAYSVTGSGLGLDRISLDELGANGVAVPSEGDPERVMVSCGPPRMDLRVVGPEGDLPERNIGEIFVRGESLMSGYVGRDVDDPFADGWLQTGDMGYLAGGELYVTGRAKDMMIALGQNYYPEDFEWAAGRVDGVRPGRSVAFTLPDSEEIVVLVEAQDGRASSRLEREVRRGVADAVGISPVEVAILPPGTVQKTTSGKLRRGAMREAYASGTLVEAVA